MTKHTRKLINISLALAMSACLIISMTGFTNSCDDMYQNIIRIRVIANSDSDIDQSVKLKVRDSILSYSKELFNKATTYDDAVLIAKGNVQDINQNALQTLLQNGLEYSVTTEIRQEYFDTRKYDEFSLPAGSYETLVVTLGEGKGENWWCVMYPPLCFSELSTESNKKEMKKVLSETEYELVTSDTPKVLIKFKTVELWNKFKKMF